MNVKKIAEAMGVDPRRVYQGIIDATDAEAAVLGAEVVLDIDRLRQGAPTQQRGIHEEPAT